MTQSLQHSSLPVWANIYRSTNRANLELENIQSSLPNQSVISQSIGISHTSALQFCIYIINTMYDFLDVLSHEHHPQAKQLKQQSNKPLLNIIQLPHSSAKVNSDCQSKKCEKAWGVSETSKMQHGKPAKLKTQTLRILEDIRDQSSNRVGAMIDNMINQHKSAVQKKVYVREISNNNQEYLEEIQLQDSNENPLLKHIRNGLTEVMESVSGSILSDIVATDQYPIHHKVVLGKEEMFLLDKSIDYIKNKDGNLRSKVGELKLHIFNEAEKISDKSVEIMEKKQFSIDAPKTKQISSFLKSIQLEREKQRRACEEKAQRKKEEKMRKAKQLEAVREKMNLQRHQQLVQAYSVKRRAKKEEFEAAKKREQQFREWVKAYKKRVPLYQAREQQFANFVRQQQSDNFHKMLQKKQFYAPIAFEEIQDHKQRYIDIKRQNSLRRESELSLQKQAEQQRSKELKKFRQCKFRDFVLQELNEHKRQLLRDPQEDAKKNRMRQKVYSQSIKQSHKPVIDPVKKMQMQALLKTQKIRHRNRVFSELHQDITPSLSDRQNERDPKIEGNRNMRYLKHYIRQKVQKGQVKQQVHSQRASTIEPRPNYLEEMRKHKGRKSWTTKQQIVNIKQNGNVEALKLQADRHDEWAKRRQTKLKHTKHGVGEEAKLESDYLYSIMAKLELLKSYD